VCCAVRYNATDPRERKTASRRGRKATGLLLSRGGSRATERSTIKTTSKPPFEEAINRTYELFLKLPEVVLLAVLWLVGAVLIGACALALYLLQHWSVFELWV
jgi:hypothetical protein